MKVADFQPQLTVPEHGPEPSIRQMLIEYYSKHLADGKVAEQLVDRYLAELDKQVITPLLQDLFLAEKAVREASLASWTHWANREKWIKNNQHAVDRANKPYKDRMR